MTGVSKADAQMDLLKSDGSFYNLDLWVDVTMLEMVRLESCAES